MPNPDLDRLADDYWDAFLQREPTQGTAIGDHRYDDRLSDITPEGRAAARQRLGGLGERLERIGSDGLTDEEALSLSALRHLLRAEMAFLEADSAAYTVDAMSGPQVEFLNIPSFQPLRNPADGKPMLSRWRAMA